MCVLASHAEDAPPASEEDGVVDGYASGYVEEGVDADVEGDWSDTDGDEGGRVGATGECMTTTS